MVSYIRTYITTNEKLPSLLFILSCTVLIHFSVTRYFTSSPAASTSSWTTMWPTSSCSSPTFSSSSATRSTSRSTAAWAGSSARRSRSCSSAAPSRWPGGTAGAVRATRSSTAPGLVRTRPCCSVLPQVCDDPGSNNCVTYPTLDEGSNRSSDLYVRNHL